MISFDTVITFLIASLILAIAPGPDNIFVLVQSTINGRISGIFVTLGLATGLIFHTLAVILGVAIIFQKSELAFDILKFTGAIYLLYLAWQNFKSLSKKIDLKGDKDLNYKKLYLRGIFMNITNPKVSIFFLAFLPQFADPSKGNISIQFIILGALFIVSTILIFGIIAFLGGTLGEILNRSNKIQTVLNKIAGVVFIGLAIKLAVTKRN